MIKDLNGNEFTYWPIQALVEGQVSQTLVIVIDTPLDGKLKSSDDDRIIVWARENGSSDPFTDITTGELDLSGYAGPTASFDVYVEALTPISGIVSLPITVVAGESSPAGWAN